LANVPMTCRAELRAARQGPRAQSQGAGSAYARHGFLARHGRLQSAIGAIPVARWDGPGLTGFVRKQSWAALLREAT
jgi:hypothetical protein